VIEQDEELHAELLRLFRVYFEANQRWINEGTKRAGMDVRKALLDIRKIATLRRDHIMEWRRWKNTAWEESKQRRKEQKANKLAQKQSKASLSDDN
jgi:hypothetical protein